MPTKKMGRPTEAKPNLYLGRSKDKTLDASKEWLKGMGRAMAGKEIEDNTTPKEWERSWHKF